jgi:hypothetical protein
MVLWHSTIPNAVVLRDGVRDGEKTPRWGNAVELES